jgi:hypothetical protein
MIRRVKAFTARHLAGYLEQPGDGRVAPVVPAAALLWSLLAAYLLREGAFHAVEALVHSRARRALGVRHRFGDDTLAYFTERLAVGPTRTAIVRLIREAKRRKVFDDVWLIGLVLDGTTVGRCPTVRCPGCHSVIVPHHDATGQPSPVGTVVGQQHKLSLLAVVGGELVLPADVEPYGPRDSEQGASLRLLDRSVAALGRRFAQYVVADSLYASAPFLHAVGDRGLHAVVRLKANVPTLAAAARARFEGTAPTLTFEDDGTRVERWDAADFDPWEELRWPTVRVIRYRQHHRDGTTIEAYWLTDFSPRRVSTRTLYRLAKGRWTIENQGFNDSKSRYGLDHVPHHEATSLLIHWLLVLMTLTLEWLYRLRSLRRGTHAPLSAITLVRRLRLSLGQPVLDSG